MAGNKIKINMITGGLPNMSSTLNGWEVNIIADYISQENIDGEIVNKSKIRALQGVLQPLRTEEVQLKPEGQRAWSWYQLHVKSSYELLRVEQVIKINKIDYKIMAIKNYDIYGYIEYHIIRDFE